MYHAISVRLPEQDSFDIEGHAYNVSDGGIQFELDDPIQPGTDIAMMIHLPRGFDTGPGRAVFVMGRVVWISDVEEPGPIRMAMSFNLFPRQGDQKRLHRYLNRTNLRIAA